MTFPDRLAIASRNRHKLREIVRICADWPVAWITSEHDDGDWPDVDEPYETYRENALHKARSVAAALGVAGARRRLGDRGGRPRRWSRAPLGEVRGRGRIRRREPREADPGDRRGPGGGAFRALPVRRGARVDRRTFAGGRGDVRGDADHRASGGGRLRLRPGVRPGRARRGRWPSWPTTRRMRSVIAAARSASSAGLLAGDRAAGERPDARRLQRPSISGTPPSTSTWTAARSRTSRCPSAPRRSAARSRPTTRSRSSRRSNTARARSRPCTNPRCSRGSSEHGASGARRASRRPRSSRTRSRSPPTTRGCRRRGRRPAPRAAGAWVFDAASPILEGTYTAARASADVALTTADLVLGGETSAYGLCRPPGHHAARAMMGGYCFFNNAAIVAEDLVRRAESRVAILDVDYHHGNGTQQVFYGEGRRALRLAPRRPRTRVPVLLGVRRGDGERSPARARTSTSRCRSGARTTPTSRRSRGGSRRSGGSSPTTWSSRSASTRTTSIRSATWRSPPRPTTRRGGGSASSAGRPCAAGGRVPRRPSRVERSDVAPRPRGSRRRHVTAAPASVAEVDAGLEARSDA